MMSHRRLLPDTVVGRTALVLVAALLVSLAGALAVFAIQRSEALMAVGVRNGADRVAALARLLEEAPADTRLGLLRSMDNPGFRAGWGNAPLVQVDEADGVAGTMGRQLHVDLGDHEVRVSSQPQGPGASGLGRGAGGPGMHMGMGPHSSTGFGPALRISVRLADATWLNVFAPQEWPEPLWQARFLVPVVLSLAIVAAAALLAVRRAVRPFAVFANAAERLGVDVGSPPLAVTGPREVRRATHAFNVMQARIRRFVEDRTLMLAAISHDLRTPITRLKLRAEFVEDDAERTRMLADLDEMERMIAATLVFARDDAAREERRQTDLAALIQGLVEDMAASGAEASYDGPERLVALVRPMALKRALANLVHNAVTYGGHARVRLAGGDGEIVAVIDDDGPGIPDRDRERVFSPFVRLETSRSRDTGGTGLGLSVARAAIRAHGGDIVLENRAEGGLRVTVTLPV
jgi:signal transduction histidine kinase